MSQRRLATDRARLAPPAWAVWGLLLGLVAGLPEQVATRAAVQAVANGLAIGWVAFSFRSALSRRARRLRGDVGSLRDLLAGRLGGLA